MTLYDIENNVKFRIFSLQEHLRDFLPILQRETRKAVVGDPVNSNYPLAHRKILNWRSLHLVVPDTWHNYGNRSLHEAVLK